MLRSTDKQLLAHLDRLCRRERTTCVEVLLDLVKVENRRLHAMLGYASLFSFATHHMHYSESAAGRRVQAARCVRNHPEVIPLLRRGDMNLSTLCLVSRVLTRENKRTLLARAAGKSQREVEAIVAHYAPPQRVRDRIRAVKVEKAERTAALDTGSASVASLGSRATGATTPEHHSRGGSETASQGDDGQVGAGPRAKQRPPHAIPQQRDDSRGTGTTARESETQFKVQFMASAEFMLKFEAVRGLLSSRLPQGVSIESVLEAGLEAFLDRNCPTRRNERRKAREEKQATRLKREATDRTDQEPAGRSLPQREWPREQSREGPTERPTRTVRRRAVPAAVRDAVFERDGGCCTFVGIDGRRCGSRHDLEIDHCQPVTRGGASTMDNLRLLCAAHNRLEAERIFGTAWMQRFTRS